MLSILEMYPRTCRPGFVVHGDLFFARRFRRLMPILRRLCARVKSCGL